MSLAFVPITPGMDLANMASALNQNFQLLQNLFITQIINDTTGTPRIVFGRLPDNTYGLVISKPGEDVIKALGF